MDAVERFWSNTRVGPVHPALGTACREWARSTDRKGYGQVSFRRKHRACHRLAWELQYGSIPEGMCVLHKCDNRRCLRGDHLFLGTVLDNNADMRAKGRHAFGDRNGIRANPSARVKGSRHGRSKLTEEKVRAIRDRYVLGGPTQAALASEFGVTPGHVSEIVNRKIWTHI